MVRQRVNIRHLLSEIAIAECDGFWHTNPRVPGLNQDQGKAIFGIFFYRKKIFSDVDDIINIERLLNFENQLFVSKQ